MRRPIPYILIFLVTIKTPLRVIHYNNIILDMQKQTL